MPYIPGCVYESPPPLVFIGSEPPGAAILLGGTNLLQADGRTPARTPFAHQFLRPGERLNYELNLDNQHETAVLSATGSDGTPTRRSSTAALRRAKLSLAGTATAVTEQTDFRRPFYWAAYVIYGLPGRPE